MVARPAFSRPPRSEMSREISACKRRCNFPSPCACRHAMIGYGLSLRSESSVPYISREPHELLCTSRYSANQRKGAAAVGRKGQQSPWIRREVHYGHLSAFPSVTSIKSLLGIPRFTVTRASNRDDEPNSNDTRSPVQVASGHQKSILDDHVLLPAQTLR
jgi:hypothetical protein